MEITVKQPTASTQLSRRSANSLSEPERLWKQAQIVPLLSKLGIRRQAKLDKQDYDVFAEDLVHFQIQDIEAGLDDLAKFPRRDGETAFPELPRMKQAIIERKLTREAAEIRQQEADEAQHRRDHPEDYVTWKDIWESPEGQRLKERMQMEKQKRPPFVGTDRRRA
jgi:hypothetical protein